MKRRQFGSTRRLPSGRWQVRYFDSAGVRHTASKTFATKADAGRYLAAIETDMARADWTNPRLGLTTFAEWSSSWMEAATHLRHSTRVLYGSLLKVHLLPTFGDKRLARITTLDVQHWLGELRTNSRLSDNSIAKAYRLLARILGAAVESGFIPRSPCTVKGAGRERLTKEMRFATAEQVAALSDAVPARYRALILSAAYSGLRWGELAGLRVKKVNLLHKTITVAEQLTEVRGEISIGPPKTAAALRTVAIPSFVAEALENHLAEYVVGGADALVFTSPEGTALRRSSFTRRAWLPATRQVGLEGLRFHDLRHTGLTLAAASGAPLKALMARAGHTTPDAALRYQHVVSGQDEAIADYLETLARAAAVVHQDRAEEL